MNSKFSAETEAFIHRQIESGGYADRDSVLRAAMSLLQQRTELVERLAEGRRQLDEGEYIDYDESSLAERFEHLKQRKTAQRNAVDSANS